MAHIQTVLGPIAPEELGVTLIHEHVLCDFVGADETGPHRWDREEVVAVMRPYLEEASERGVRALADCSPAYLGRDPLVLRRLSELTSMHLITNTGWYKEPYLPPEAVRLTPQEIAARWLAEWEEGIESTGIHPGFVKVAVHPEPLQPMQAKIVRAAAIVGAETGLAVACHTGHAGAAHACLDLVEDEGMDPARWIVVHADGIEGPAEHEALARRGAWLEYDGVGARPLEHELSLLRHMLDRGWEGRLLISHDAGWYNVGEPRGGSVRPYTAIHDALLPALRADGVPDEIIQRLLVTNPARALALP